MNEATIKRGLVKTLRADLPGCVVFRHEDRFTGGVPDLSLTWSGHTVWIEVKYSRPGRKSKLSPLQARTLAKLRAAGALAYCLTYVDGPTPRTEVSWACIHSAGQPVLNGQGWGGLDHGAVSRWLRSVV